MATGLRATTTSTGSFFPFFFLLLTSTFASGSNTTTPFHVGLLLDTESSVGMTCKLSVSMAVEDFYAQHEDYSTRLVLHRGDTGNSTVGAVAAALDVLEKDHVRAIVGPQRSAQADFISDLGRTTQVPIVSFTATSPTLTSSHPPYFIRAASNDSSQVNAIASLVKAFGWRQVVPIYEDTTFGTGVVPYLTDALQGVDARVPHRSVLPLEATDDRILEELYKLMTMQTRVFVVHMSPLIGSRLFRKAREIGMMSEGYVWIITDALTDVLEALDPLTIKSMQGVLGVKHFVDPETDRYEDFELRWEKRFRQEHPDARSADLSIYGVWGYDAVWALAMAVESIKDDIESMPQDPAGESNNSSIDLENLDVSRIGPKLRDAILTTRFDGIAGRFHLIDNQLQSSTFQIVNVIGKVGREVRFWTPCHGLSRTLLPPERRNKYCSTLATDLGVVIWPGESASVPRGWQTPTNDKILKIGVPVKAAFNEFVKVEYDHVTNATKVTGYSIDVFESTLQKLPYAISYEYVPFANDEGQMAGSYTDLVKAVCQQKFDAVVGDVTITAERSEYVDFTLPYTECGVAMISSVRKDANKNTWIFLKPLTLDLWLSTFGFIIYTGFVVWVIEHKMNEAFRGPWHEQLGVIFYFIFSTLVFSHKENIRSNFSRIVVIIWVFVVLVLTSSYTASLTSILTLKNLEPTVRDIQQLVENGDVIGYKKGSFLKGLLSKTFDISKMRELDDPASYHEALQNGTVSAVFHEIPYIRLFLSQHCSGYAMSEPTHKTAGFGFVFPKGSPLVPDMSRAILNVTEEDQFVELEKKWLGGSCVEQDNSFNPRGLTFRSFWGLFLITGATSILAALINLTILFYREKDQLIVGSKARIRSIFEHLKAMNRSILEKIQSRLKHHRSLKRERASARVHDAQDTDSTFGHLDDSGNLTWMITMS